MNCNEKTSIQLTTFITDDHILAKLGTVANSTRKKQEGNASAETVLVPNEKMDPIVAFSRPPPLPPVFGPVIALSFFEMWSSHDGDDD